MWEEAVIDGHWCQAKVYDTPSVFGIDEGRVSKLTIATNSQWEGMESAIYHYDRGLDFDKTPPGLLNTVVAYFEEVGQSRNSTGNVR